MASSREGIPARALYRLASGIGVSSRGNSRLPGKDYLRARLPAAVALLTLVQACRAITPVKDLPVDAAEAADVVEATDAAAADPDVPASLEAGAEATVGTDLEAGAPPSGETCPGFAPDRCPEGCLNLQTDRHHCGRCDIDCAAKFPNSRQVSCQAGVCRLDSCAAGFVLREGTCQEAAFGAKTTVPLQLCPAGRDCHVADINGDGRADLVAFTKSTGTTEQEGNVYAALSAGQGSFSAPYLAHPFFCLGLETCALGDINGDRRQDLAVFTRGERSEVWAALATPDGRFSASQRWSDYFCVGDELCGLGDINGDGRDDLWVFVQEVTLSSMRGEIWVALANDVGFGRSTRYLENFCFGQDNCLAADVSGDGKDDAVVFDRQGNVRVARTSVDGGRFGAPTDWGQGLCPDGQECAAGDVNGDGKVDLVAFDKQGDRKVWVGLSTGTTILPPRAWHPDFCGPSDRCRVGDIDGDGRADLVGFGPEGHVWVALSAP
jgi:FG-GAP-like repeat